MAKNKKSKILAMALCASVMTGIYASPVMAGVIEINPDNGGLAITINSDGNPPSNGIYVDRTNPDEPKIYGMFNITADQLATALTNQDLTLNSVTMGTETINATTIAQWNAAAKASENVGGITRSAGATAPGTGTTTIEGNTSFDANNMRLGTNVDPEGIVKVSQDNGGLVRVGDKDSANVRIASNQITFMNIIPINSDIKPQNLIVKYYKVDDIIQYSIASGKWGWNISKDNLKAILENTYITSNTDQHIKPSTHISTDATVLKIKGVKIIIEPEEN